MSARNSDLEKLRIEFLVVVFEFPHLVFCGIDRFLGLFWMNPQETHSKSSSTEGYAVFVFGILQTKSLKVAPRTDPTLSNSILYQGILLD